MDKKEESAKNAHTPAPLSEEAVKSLIFIINEYSKGVGVVKCGKGCMALLSLLDEHIAFLNNNE